MLNYFFAMYILIPANVDSVDGEGTGTLITAPTWRGSVFEIHRPQTGLLAMIDEALIGIRFTTNFDAPELEGFDVVEYLCLLAFQVINLTFCIVCIILLIRLLMAMMTSTYRMVQEKAQLEWRLLVTRHVLRLELLGASLFSEKRLADYLFAGTKNKFDGKYYHNFIRAPFAPESGHSCCQMATTWGLTLNGFCEIGTPSCPRA